MALGKRPREQQTEIWIATQNLPDLPADPFYEALNALLRQAAFDDFVETLCKPYYHATRGQPGLAPGIYFRILLIGFFEAIASERGMAWRLADSLSLRKFVGYALTDKTPDHSTLCKTRQRLPVEVHLAAFSFVLQLCAKADLLTGKGIAIDASTIDANAALSSLRRRDSNLDYAEFLRNLATANGVVTPTKADLVRFDKDREDKTLSNDDWQNPHDPDAKITKTKHHGTRLAFKVEHAVETGNGVIIAAVVHPACDGDTTTGPKTLDAANTELLKVIDAAPDAKLPEPNVPLDNGYHSQDFLEQLLELGFEPFAVEKKFGRPGKLGFKPTQSEAVLRNRESVYTELGDHLYRKRAEMCERSFAHTLETGGLRKIFVHGLVNVQKRYSLHAAAYNLGILCRKRFGVGSARSMADKSKAFRAQFRAALQAAVLAVFAALFALLFAKLPSNARIGYNIVEVQIGALRRLVSLVTQIRLPRTHSFRAAS